MTEDYKAEGAPGWRDNTCPYCGDKKRVYVRGSWDIEPKVCFKCTWKAMQDDFKKAEEEEK